MKQRIISSMCDNQSASVKKCDASETEQLQYCINANEHHFEHFWRKNHCFFISFFISVIFISLFNDD